MKYKIIIFGLCVFSFCHYAVCQNDTLNLFYNINIYKLNKSNYSKIDNYLKQIDLNFKYNVQVISSADYLGSKEANYLLAQNRANQIKELLIIKNDTIFKSFELINKGEIEDQSINNEIGNLNNRKTSIIFKKIIRTEIQLTNIKNKKLIKTENPSEYGKIEIGQTFAIKDLIFFAGTAKMKINSKSTLIKLAKFLKKNPTINFEIIGHLCCNADNRNPSLGKPIIKYHSTELSVQRARFVYKFLYHKGIKKDRMVYYGYQFQLPLFYPEKNTKEMNANKRVEIKITKL